MKLLFNIIFFVCSFSLSFAGEYYSYTQSKQTMSQEGSAPDTIIRLNRKRIICKVTNIRSAVIYYKEIGDNTQKEIDRKQIEKIHYGNGKKEVFNKPPAVMVNEDDWQAVIVTEDPKMIEFMYNRGKIDAESTPSSRNIKAAKQSAIIRLQKKGASKGANIILITKTEAKGGYGDFPSYYVEGIGYSFDPPPAGTEEK